MSCILTLEEIEIKKQQLERYLADVVGKELAIWQQQNHICISDVSIRLASIDPTNSKFNQNIVTGVSVDIDH
ncbi:MAG: hypothetical protein QM666_00990 [Acinetobacter sp.]